MRYKKPTRLFTNAEFLRPLARRCNCAVHEVQLMDAAYPVDGPSVRQAHLAAEYPPALATRWAELVAEAYRASQP